MSALLRWSILPILAAASMAGCIEDGGEVLDDVQTAVDPKDALAALGLSASNCRQNGALSIYPLTEGETAGPYTKGDIREAIGFQPGDLPSVRGMAAYSGPVWGNWHMTMACESYTFNGEARQNLLMGFVGMYVDAPAWDSECAAKTDKCARHQWLVDGISFSDPDWGTALSKLTGSRIGVMERSILDWIVPDRVAYMEYDEGHHGWFEIRSEIKPYAEKMDENYRFWVQVPYNDAGQPTAWEEATQFRPLALDLFDTATGGGMKAGGLAYLLHYHADGELAHNGDEKGLYEDGFNRAFVVGDHPELLLKESWTHN